MFKFLLLSVLASIGIVSVGVFAGHYLALSIGATAIVTAFLGAGSIYGLIVPVAKLVMTGSTATALYAGGTSGSTKVS